MNGEGSEVTMGKINKENSFSPISNRKFTTEERNVPPWMNLLCHKKLKATIIFISSLQ